MPAPGHGELFAALIGEAEGATEGAPGAAKPDKAEDEAAPATVDVSTLLPMLDQQRAAAAVPTLVPGGTQRPPEAVTPGESPVIAQVQPQAVQRPGTSAPELAATPSTAPVAVPEGKTAQTVTELPHRTEAPDAGPARPPTEVAGTVKSPTATAGKAPLPQEPQVPTDAAVPTKPAAQPGTIRAEAPAALSEQAIAASAAGRLQAPLTAAARGQVRAERGAAPVEAPQTGSEAGAPPAQGAVTDRAVAPPSPIAGAPPLAAAPLAHSAAPVQNIAAAIAEQVLDLARGSEWIDELARDIVRAGSSEGTMRFRLTPETLGELRVEITHSERGAHVRLNVTSEAAQQALADAQPKLVAEARAQGIRIAEAEVSLAGGHSQGRDGREAQGRPDQPSRTLRASAGTVPDTEDARPANGRRRDRYA